MKKTWKAARSLLCALVLLLQLAGPVASADSTSSVTGEEALICAAYVPAPTTEDPDATAQITDENIKELLDGKSFSVTVGTADIPAKADGGMKLSALTEGDLRITPPEGYSVRAVYLRGGAPKDKEPLLPTDAVAPVSGAEKLTVLSAKKESFLAEGKFDESLLASYADSENLVYTLAVYFDKLESGEITVSYDLNGVAGEIPSESDTAGTQFTVRTLSEEQADTAREALKAFAGWKLTYENGSSAEISEGALITPYMDCTLEAQWDDAEPTRTSYTVTFEANGHGSAPEAQTVQEGQTATEPTAPTADGWTFEGWFTDADCTDLFDFETTITEDITLYAKWTETPPAPTYYTVTFEANGHGSAPEALSVREGQTAAEPTALTADGWTFGGWFTDAGCTNPFDFETAITEDITLYAKWTEKAAEPTVTPELIKLSIQAVTAEKVYDGKALKASSYSESGYTNGYKVSGLAEGHKIEGVTVSGEALTPGTAVTTKVDTSKLKIVDTKDGNKDVTASYQVQTKNGKLTITKRSLVLTAVSGSQEYNGQTIQASDLMVDGYDGGYRISGDGLVSGHTLSAIEVDGEGKNVGSYATSIFDPGSITVSNGNEDVTACYAISTAKGKLTITAHPVTVSAINGTATATGETIYAKSYSGNGFTHGYKAEGLLDGHKLSGDFVTGSGVDADFDTGIDVSKLKILDSKDKEVTGNYAITTVSGRMKIKAKQAEQTATPITVTASASKVYDASPLTIGNSNIRVTQGTLPSDYTLEASFGPTTSITDVQKISVSLSDVKVKDGSGKDVTSAFRVTTVTGTMEVTKKPLTLTAESASKTYDGKALVNKNVRATALASKNHDLSVEYEITNSDGKVIKNGAVNVGTYTKRITSVTIKEGSRDVTSNYDIRKVDGKLTITAGSTTQNDAKNPKTGDERKLSLWLGILIFSAVLVLAIIVILFLNARKKGVQKTPKPRKQKKQKK